jgi:hypothetical protein
MNGADTSRASGIAGFYVYNSGATASGNGRVAGSVDNVAVSSWQALTAYNATGSTNSHAFSFGNDATNRAFGAIAGSSTSAGSAAGDFVYALVLQNTTDQTLTSLNVSYKGEQWYEAAAASGVAAGAQSIRFSYLTTDTFDPANNIPTQKGLGTYTVASDLDFTSPITGNTTTSAIKLDGTDSANSLNLSTKISTAWAPGSYLILRFWDDDDNGNDHALAIDNLSFSASVPEPASLCVALLIGAGLLSRCRK